MRSIFNLSLLSTTFLVAALTSQASAQPLQIDQNEFEAEVLDSDLPVLVDFWATWCPPCKKLNPVITRISEKYSGRLKVVKIENTANKEIFRSEVVRAVPALRYYQDGVWIHEQIGFHSEDQLSETIDAIVAQHKAGMKYAGRGFYAESDNLATYLENEDGLPVVARFSDIETDEAFSELCSKYSDRAIFVTVPSRMNPALANDYELQFNNEKQQRPDGIIRFENSSVVSKSQSFRSSPDEEAEYSNQLAEIERWLESIQP